MDQVEKFSCSFFRPKLFGIPKIKLDFQNYQWGIQMFRSSDPKTNFPQDQKSDNLQYNTLGPCDKQIIDQDLMFQVLIFVFHNFLQIYLQKSFHFFFSFFYKLTKIKTKRNAWNIRHLFDESFIQLTQCIILKIVGFLASKGSKAQTKGWCCPYTIAKLLTSILLVIKYSWLVFS